MAIIVKPQTESSVTADLAPWTLALDWDSERLRLTVAGSGSEWRQVSNSLPHSGPVTPASHRAHTPALAAAGLGFGLHPCSPPEPDQELPPPSETASSKTGGRLQFWVILKCQWLWNNFVNEKLPCTKLSFFPMISILYVDIRNQWSCVTNSEILNPALRKKAKKPTLSKNLYT